MAIEATDKAGGSGSTVASTDRPSRTRDAAEAQHDVRPRWVAIGLLGFGGFIAVSLALATGATFPFDQPLLDTAKSWSAWMPAWRLLSDAANLPLIAIGVGLVLGLFATHHRREALLVIVTLALVTAGSEAVKQLVARPRPPGGDVVVPGVIYSYPSGHVLEALTIFGIIAILAWRSELPRIVAVVFSVLVVVFVALVAVARVAIDAHYPSDVVGGLLAGLGVLALFALLAPRRLRTAGDHQRTSKRMAPASDEPMARPAAGR